MLSTITRGAAAGAIGTLAMDLLWYSRYRRGGGREPFSGWEITKDLETWDAAPAPGRMGKRLLELVLRRPVPVDHAATVSNVMHWAYGTGWTVLNAAAVRRRPWWAGPAFGALVWSSDYIVLPVAGVYEPIWRYDVPTLAKDLSAHLVFGTVADGALRVL